MKAKELKYNLKEVVKPKDLDSGFLKRIERRYGEIDMTNDFFNDELSTYFKTDNIDTETGQISHKIIKLGNFGDAIKELSQALEAINNLSKSDDGKKDPKIAIIAQDVRDVFNKFRTYIRTEYPEQYVTIKNLLDEISTTAAGGNYRTIFAFKKTKKQPLPELNPGATLGLGPKAGAKGVTNNYYVKGFKYKVVDPKKLAAKSKAIDTKYLWGTKYV